MEQLLSYVWILFILTQCINGAFWWFRGVKENPERRQGYKKLVLGWIILGNIPWLIIGAGTLLGRLSSIEDVFHPSRGNPFAIAFHISIVALVALASYWIYLGNGAQIMVDHPGLSNRPFTGPAQVKLSLAASCVGAMFAEIMMWFQK